MVMNLPMCVAEYYDLFHDGAMTLQNKHIITNRIKHQTDKSILDNKITVTKHKICEEKIICESFDAAKFEQYSPTFNKLKKNKLFEQYPICLGGVDCDKHHEYYVDKEFNKKYHEYYYRYPMEDFNEECMTTYTNDCYEYYKLYVEAAWNHSSDEDDYDYEDAYDDYVIV
jgi:hypothetical protein